jgi:hypothetical protein
MAIPIPVPLVLDRALRDAGIPIDGVSVGDPAVRATWRALYQASATAAQRTQGDQILATIDPQDAATLANIKADLTTTRANDDLIRAIVQGLWEAIPAPTMTLAQLKTRVLTIYRGLV